MTKFGRGFTKFATAISRWTGRPPVFAACCILVFAWALSGPLFGFSDTWQLVINTSTTIVTFLMVFLIQNTQNRDNNAIQAKLDELIRVGKSSNSFIGIENLDDEELEAILAKLDQMNARLRNAEKATAEAQEVKAEAPPARRKTPAKPVSRKPAAKRAPRKAAQSTP